MFWKHTKIESGELWGYDDISLRLYIDIAKSGEFTKLVKGGDVDDDKCLLQWEAILKRQQKEIGSNQYSSFLALTKAYLTYLNDHKIIRATLIVIALKNKQEGDSRDGSLIWVNLMTPEVLGFVEWVGSKGYKVDLTSYESVLESVNIGLHRCENLITKAETKRKELEKIIKSQKGESNEAGFEAVMAHLNSSLGFIVNDDLTLARFNEYQKILKARRKAQEENNKGNGGNRS